MAKRGRVQRDTSVGDGVLSVDGKQYAFSLEGMWHSEMPPRLGMLVDVTFDSEGAPESIVAVRESQVAKEQAEQALAGARRHSGAIAGSIKARFGLAVLAAEVGLLAAFFLLPNVTIGFMDKSLTGWEAIGLNLSMMTANDHGMLSLLAIVCLFAPVVVPVLKQVWARWLNAAPLGFLVLALISVASQMHSAATAAGSMGEELGGAAGREMARQLGPSYSVAAGAYVAVICALYLCTRAFKNS